MATPDYFLGSVDQFAVGDVVVVDVSVKNADGTYLDTTGVSAMAFGFKDLTTGVKTPGQVSLLDPATATYRCLIPDTVTAGLSPVDDATYLGQLRLTLALGKSTVREFTLALQDSAL